MATFIGADEADTLEGGPGDDSLQGLGGDDVLADLAGGDDVLSGGDGDDLLWVARQSADSQPLSIILADGGNGNDRFRIEALDAAWRMAATLIGGAGADLFEASGHASLVIDAGEGDDVLMLELAGAATAALTLGSGRDLVRVLAFDGSAPQDWLIGDFEAGDSGDRIDLSPWFDTQFPDWQGFNPFAIGALRLEQSGADTLVQLDRTGEGSDWQTLFTLAGVVAAELTAANFSGHGPDGAAPAGLVLDGGLAADWLIGAGLGDSLRGDAGDDRLFGHGGPDWLAGDEGDDRLDGGDGADGLAGGAGRDVLIGGAGDDFLDATEPDRATETPEQLFGGAGDDSYHVDGMADVVFEAEGEGYDQVIANGSYYLWDNVEALVLATDIWGEVDSFGVGNALDNSIIGNDGNNLLIGGAGQDELSGGWGDDQLFGETGDDALYGDDGIDYLVGGEGNDWLDGGWDADALYGEDGDDTLVAGNGFVTDILVGGAGADVLIGAGPFREGDYDLMDGGPGNDSYYVDTPADLTFEAEGGGEDTVYADIEGAGYYLYAFTEHLVLEGETPFGVGNELDNRLTGNAIGNYLLGGLGDDTLNGKGGNDVLFGEGGADTFVFERGTGGDVIGDFQPGTDRISLNGLGFDSHEQLQPHIFEVGGNTGINLGQGDFIVLNGVTNVQLSAADFQFG